MGETQGTMWTRTDIGFAGRSGAEAMVCAFKAVTESQGVVVFTEDRAALRLHCADGGFRGARGDDVHRRC
jgi:hypothetical protein